MRVEVNLHIVLHHRLIPAGGGGESCSPDDVGGRIRMVDGSYLRAALPTMSDTDYCFQSRAFQLTAVYPYHPLSLCLLIQPSSIFLFRQLASYAGDVTCHHHATSISTRTSFLPPLLFPAYCKENTRATHQPQSP